MDDLNNIEERDIEITELERMPPALKELLIDELSQTTTVDFVVIGAFIQDFGNKVGAYYPETRTIVIDMGNALNSMAFYNKGMMFIPNVWYTLIHTIGHEICHAMQYETIPELLNYKVLPQEYEDQANAYGEELVGRWAQAHNRIPDINTMGWLGEQLVVLINNMYSKTPDIVDDLEYMSAGAVAHLDAALAHDPDYADEDLRARTIKDVDDGVIGLKVNGKRFLGAYDFIGLVSTNII